MRLQILKILQKIFVPLELIAIVILIYGIFKTEGLQTISLALVGLAVIYFIASFFQPPDTIKGLIMTTVFKLLKIGSSVSIIGIMFNQLSLSGDRAILYVGLTTIILCLLVILIGILIKPDTANQIKWWTFRGLIIAGYTAVLLAFPEKLG